MLSKPIWLLNNFKRKKQTLAINITVSVLFVLVFSLFFSWLSTSYYKVKFYSKINAVQIIISNQIYSKDSFLYLNRQSNLYYNDKYVDVDVLMPFDDVDYSSALFAEKIEELNSYQTPVAMISSQTASEHNLKLGDMLEYEGTEYELIALIAFPIGFNQDYQREGIMLINYDESLLQNPTLSFISNLGITSSLISVWSVEGILQGALLNWIIGVFIILILMIIIIFTLEFTLEKDKIIEYGYYLKNGYSKKQTVKIVFFDLTLKYLSTIFLVIFMMLLIFYKSYSSFTFIIIGQLLTLLIVCLITLAYLRYIRRGKIKWN